MKLIYSLFIQLYFGLARVYGLFNKKANHFVKGHLVKTAPEIYSNQKKRVWFHISSLGEYEQAKPIIAELSQTYKIIITFFSPSGFEHKSVREFTNDVFYLGKDTRIQAKKNIHNIKPNLFVLVKYDIWVNHVLQMSKSGIPILLISGLFNKSQIYFKPYGFLFKRTLHCINTITLQNKESADLLYSIGISNTIVCGDTRVDSVLNNVSKANEILPEEILKFKAEKKCLVIGSSYNEDEKAIAGNYDNGIYKVIIAPHNISESRLVQIESTFNECTRLTKLNPEKNVLIIDSIGLLKYLYAKADIAYVGGGFGKTVHNTLEPAAFGIPIIFGPNYSAFIEAKELVKTKAAFSIDSPLGFKKTLNYLSQTKHYNQARKASKFFISQNSGASKIVLKEAIQLLK